MCGEVVDLLFRGIFEVAEHLAEEFVQPALDLGGRGAGESDGEYLVDRDVFLDQLPGDDADQRVGFARACAGFGGSRKTA